MGTVDTIILLSPWNSNILAVYTNFNTLTTFANICQNRGRYAVACTSVEQAIQQLNENRANFQLTFIDMQLAQQSNFEFIHRARQSNLPTYVTYNCDAPTLQAFLDDATLHGAINHLTHVRWEEDAPVPNFGMLRDIYPDYVQTPLGQAANAVLNANIQQNVALNANNNQNVVPPGEAPQAIAAQAIQNPAPAPANAARAANAALNAENYQNVVPPGEAPPAIAAQVIQNPAPANAAEGIQIPHIGQIQFDLQPIYVSYAQTPQGQQFMAELNLRFPRNVVPPGGAPPANAAQANQNQHAQIPGEAANVQHQGENQVEVNLNIAHPYDAPANAAAIQNVDLDLHLAPPAQEEPNAAAIQIPHAQIDADADDDIDTTLSLEPPAQRRRLE